MENQKIFKRKIKKGIDKKLSEINLKHNGVENILTWITTHFRII